MIRTTFTARLLLATAAFGLATAATAQDAQGAQGGDPQSVAPAPVNPPKGGGGDAPNMSNVDKAPPAKAPAGAGGSATSTYTAIPFASNDPEAPGNPEGDRKMHIHAERTWQKHWQDRGFEKVTDPSTRSTVVIGGVAY